MFGANNIQIKFDNNLKLNCVQLCFTAIIFFDVKNYFLKN